MKIAIVVNPATVDDPNELRSAIVARDPHAELLWLETTEDDTGAGQTKQALAADAELLLVCGGDGTVAACAGALAGSGVPMALIPTGTGNLLARNLRLPLELQPALDCALSTAGERRIIDLLDADGRRFVVMAGLGFDAALIRDTGEQAKKRHGWPAYVAGGLRALRNTPHANYLVEVDGAPPCRERALGVIVANVGELQGGMAILPDADPEDGLLDVIVLTPRGPLGLVVLAWRILRRNPARGRAATALRGARVVIHADRAVPVEFDGDYAGERDSMTVTVLRGGVTVCVG
jgi:diacylglycerol kinase (ATP)